MSGIYGVLYKDGTPVTTQTLVPLHDAMVQWGPDGHGCWYEGAVGLGHLMLHVTRELLHECLPATHPHIPGLVITADARIDNREDLCAALDIPAVDRHDMPDSRLILLAYDQWSEACAEKLIGAFAFAIWDARHQTLFCARDHMGFKPFLYHDTPRLFVFASDIRGLLACPDVPQRLNEPLLAACLQQMTAFAEKRLSYYEGLVKLPPAHHLGISATHTRLERYWSLEEVPEVRLPSDAVYVERLRELLHQAVRCRLRSAFPVGSHLSGGLDSSTLTVIAARTLRRAGQTLTAFSWSPPLDGDAPPDDERVDVEEIRRHEVIPCHYTALTEKDVIRVHTRDFTTEPTEMMYREQHVQARAARDGVRVILSGWGGDESVSSKGRGYEAELFLSGQWLTLHRELVLLARTTNGWWGRRLKRYGGLVYREVLYPLIPDGLYGLREPYGLNRPSPLSCINPDFAWRHQDAVLALRGPGLRIRPGLRAMQRRSLDHGHLTRRIEDWATSGMEHRLVYRYPLLDRRILEFCLGIPPGQFCQGGSRRTLFRRAIEGVLPEHLQWKPSKFEAATFGVTRSVFPRAFAALFAGVRMRDPGHPVAEYVDIARLEEVMPCLSKVMAGSGVVRNAVSCFSIRQLAG